MRWPNMRLRYWYYDGYKPTGTVDTRASILATADRSGSHETQTSTGYLQQASQSTQERRGNGCKRAKPWLPRVVMRWVRKHKTVSGKAR